MVKLLQIIWSVLSTHIFWYDAPIGHPGKRIAIVGAGSAGLAMLRSLAELPEANASNWNIVVFDDRDRIGGVWVPDPYPAGPPEIPDTPLYPLLKTNTPVPSMSYPNFPFPKGTHLYPPHEDIQAYHARFVDHHNLTRFIHFEHKVLKASWKGNSDAGHWDVTYRDPSGRLSHAVFDHLVVATGNNHLPRIPTWRGQDKWINTTSRSKVKREIFHSIWYRGPEKYLGRRVLVVGSGSSGRDITSQIIPFAEKTYVSVRHEPDPLVGPVPEGAIVKGEISYFTPQGVVLMDGSTLDVDTVLLATGYEIRKPFLEEGGAIITDQHAHSTRSHPEKLVSNTRYVFPLHQHIFSLSSDHPVNALAFIGLPSAIANCPSDIAQSIFASHAILNSSLLAPREELLNQLAIQEKGIREAGYDPYIIGHKMLTNTSSDYQDDLIDYLKSRGALIDDGKKFVEPWRRDIFKYGYLREGWKRIESLGRYDDWLEGVETEEQWSDLMFRVNRWQEEWAKTHKIPFRLDFDLVG